MVFVPLMHFYELRSNLILVKMAVEPTIETNRLAELIVDEGDFVTAGEVLAIMD